MEVVDTWMRDLVTRGSRSMDGRYGAWRQQIHGNLGVTAVQCEAENGGRRSMDRRCGELSQQIYGDLDVALLQLKPSIEVVDPWAGDLVNGFSGSINKKSGCYTTTV